MSGVTPVVESSAGYESSKLFEATSLETSRDLAILEKQEGLFIVSSKDRNTVWATAFRLKGTYFIDVSRVVFRRILAQAIRRSSWNGDGSRQGGYGHGALRVSSQNFSSKVKGRVRRKRQNLIAPSHAIEFMIWALRRNTGDLTSEMLAVFGAIIIRAPPWELNETNFGWSLVDAALRYPAMMQALQQIHNPDGLFPYVRPSEFVAYEDSESPDGYWTRSHKNELIPNALIHRANGYRRGLMNLLLESVDSSIALITLQYFLIDISVRAGDPVVFRPPVKGASLIGFAQSQDLGIISVRIGGASAYQLSMSDMSIRARLGPRNAVQFDYKVFVADERKTGRDEESEPNSPVH